MKKIAKIIMKKFLRLVKKIDKHFLHHRIASSLCDMGGVTRMPDEEHYFLKTGKSNIEKNFGGYVPFSKVVSVPVKDIIRMQYNKYISDCFNRYDIPIRLLAIEQMEGENDFGQSWDNQLQKSFNGVDWQERFENLYRSIKEDGFDDESIIDTDWDMRIADGSHRLSIAYYLKKEFVNVRLNSFSIPDVYTYMHGKDFLYRVGFSKEQISVITEKLEEILSGCQYPFVGILWPSSRHLWNEIIKDINEYNIKNVRVLDWIDLEMSEEEINNFIRAVYYLDDVTEENLEIKRQRNLHSSRITDNCYPVRVLRIDIKNPYYRVKPVSGLPQSREIIHLKEAIRGHYAPQIYDYERDVIFHIADNYMQSKFVWKVANLDRDITELFEQINKSEVPYVVIKLNEEEKNASRYQYSMHSDIDILTQNQSIETLAEIIRSYCRIHFEDEWISYKEISKDGHLFCIVYLQDYSLVTFDLQANAGGGALLTSFVAEGLQNRIKKSLFCALPEQYEVMVRIAEYCAHKDKPRKKKHKDYALAHREWLTDEWLKKAFGNDNRKIKKILKLLQQ